MCGISRKYTSLIEMVNPVSLDSITVLNFQACYLVLSYLYLICYKQSM